MGRTWKSPRHDCGIAYSWGGCPRIAWWQPTAAACFQSLAENSQREHPAISMAEICHLAGWQVYAEGTTEKSRELAIVNSLITWSRGAKQLPAKSGGGGDGRATDKGTARPGGLVAGQAVVIAESGRTHLENCLGSLGIIPEHLGPFDPEVHFLD